MAYVMDIGANNYHNFAWCLCSRQIWVLLCGKIAAPTLFLHVEISMLSIKGLVKNNPNRFDRGPC